MIEIIPEGSATHALFQIPIGGGNDANVYRNLSQSAEAIIRSAVEHAQQFDLGLRFQLTDFIEKQGTCIRQFEEAGFGNICAAERAFFVAEEFTLNEVLR